MKLLKMLMIYMSLFAVAPAAFGAEGRKLPVGGKTECELGMKIMQELDALAVKKAQSEDKETGKTAK